jgi:hypothetical protein
MTYTPRLKEKYQTVIIKELTEQFGYKSSMRVPKLTKIVLSQGINRKRCSGFIENCWSKSDNDKFEKGYFEFQTP